MDVDLEMPFAAGRNAATGDNEPSYESCDLNSSTLWDRLCVDNGLLCGTADAVASMVDLVEEGMLSAIEDGLLEDGRLSAMEEGLLLIGGNGRLCKGVGEVFVVRAAGRKDWRMEAYVEAAPLFTPSPSFAGGVLIAASLCPRRCPGRSVGYPLEALDERVLVRLGG